MAVENYQLWQEYKENNNQEARQQLILSYLSLVKYQVGRIKMIVPDFVESDDLESFGIIGLIDALERFDYERGIKFTSYASKRIRGEIIDHLRKLDWLPHSLRQKGKKIRERAEKMAQSLGRKPTEDELARELDMSREKINSLYYKLYSSQWVSLYKELADGQLLDIVQVETRGCPENSFQDKQVLKLLTEAIDRLNEKERLVITLYYYEELTQNEIASVMELSSARISQLHKKAVYRLRGFLGSKKGQLV